MSGPTSLTIASSIALRLRCLAKRIHDQGPKPLFEMMCEVAGGADPLNCFEVYAALDADLIRAFDGDKLPPAV
jgi:hypothetical protein